MYFYINNKSIVGDRQLNVVLYVSFEPGIPAFKLLGLTLSHDLSWTSHISKLASKSRRRLGILHRVKSFLGTHEQLSSYKAFMRCSMELCSPIWPGNPASHPDRQTGSSLFPLLRPWQNHKLVKHNFALAAILAAIFVVKKKPGVEHVLNHFSDMHLTILFKLGTQITNDGLHKHVIFFRDQVQDGWLAAILVGKKNLMLNTSNHFSDKQHIRVSAHKYK